MPTCIESRSTKEFKRPGTVEKRVTGVHWRGSHVIFTGFTRDTGCDLNIRLDRDRERETCGYPRSENNTRLPSIPWASSKQRDRFRSKLINFLLACHREISIDIATSKHCSRFHTLLERPTQFYFVTARAVFASDDDRESSPYNGFIVGRMLK